MAHESLQDAWRSYRDKVYPDGIEAIQNRECHQAFCTGAWWAMQALLASANSDQALDMNEAAVRRLLLEAEQIIRARIHNLNQLQS